LFGRFVSADIAKISSCPWGYAIKVQIVSSTLGAQNPPGAAELLFGGSSAGVGPNDPADNEREGKQAD
jgi:hypothetical protein